jgi:SAM-dependent methyltransferase
MSHPDAAENFIALNRDSWNSRVDSHTQSEFYDLPAFKQGAEPLNQIELDLLGNVNNTSILHLQCHFGMDTLALARRGAMVTGVDFSEKAIDQARDLATELELEAKFICCDVYDTLSHISEPFDTVFTSYGTIGWLPDLQKWARVVAGSLKPGGKFIFVDFHPVLWMYDDHFREVTYSYFNREPIVEVSEGTYADKTAAISSTTVGWNHSLHEVFAALQGESLVIQNFQEYDYSPYACFNELEKIGDRNFQISHLKGKLPMVYSLVAEKPKS